MTGARVAKLARKRPDGTPYQGDAERKPRTFYAPLLRLDTLDAEHAAIRRFVTDFHVKNRFGPTMREVSRQLKHSAEWTRQACERLVRSGLLVKNYVGSSCALRVPDSDEYAEGLTSRWVAWLGELPESERVHLFLAVRQVTAGSVAEDFAKLHEDEPA